MGKAKEEEEEEEWREGRHENMQDKMIIIKMAGIRENNE